MEEKDCKLFKLFNLTGCEQCPMYEKDCIGSCNVCKNPILEDEEVMEFRWGEYLICGTCLRNMDPALLKKTLIDELL